MQIEELEEKGIEAIRNLRRQKLSKGSFFMINVDGLPEGQCYIEYPDGSMVVAALSSTGKDFDILKQLSTEESNAIRNQNGLF